MRFQGKTVFVTGAGTGIGYGFCLAFAQAGAAVALNDVEPNLAQTAAETINSTIGKTAVTPYAFDVSDVQQTKQAIHDFATQNGRLDILIANAGITQYGRFLDYTPEQFDLVTSVNLRGTFFSAQAAAQEMIQFGIENGRILLMASVTGIRAFKNLGTYGVTKAGIIHMASVLALELGGYGITVNAICPGATVTERTLSEDPQYDIKWSGVTPNGRVGQVSDIVSTGLFLASEQAKHISGQTIQVDGGWGLRSPIPEDHPD